MYDFTFFVDVESTYFLVPKNLKSEGAKCKKKLLKKLLKKRQNQRAKRAHPAGPKKLKKRRCNFGIISFIFSGHRMKIERSVHPHPEEIR